MLDSSTKAERFRIGLILGYAFLCLSSVFIGLGFNRAAPIGYLAILQSHFDSFAHARTDPVLRASLLTIEYLLVAAFIPGILGSLIVVLLLMAVLVLIGWVLAGLAHMAAISLTGALFVYAIVGITLTVLLRKHWGAIAEAFAWLLISIEGIWRLFVHQRFPKAAYSAAGGAGNGFRSEGGFAMARNDDDKLSDIQPRPRSDLALTPDIAVRPAGVFHALTHKIKSQMTAKALREQAEMVSSANQVTRELLTHHDLQTDALNSGDKREAKVTRQQVDVLKAKDELEEQREKNEQRVKQATNPVQRQFETEFLPRQAGEIRKPLHEAQTRAQAVVEAAAALKKLEMEIDSGAFTPEEKDLLKKQVRQEFEGILKIRKEQS